MSEGGAAPASVRLASLDGLRGLAALGVAFFHFQHFGGDAKSYPGATVEPATWLYTRGWMLVDFFFLLSGVVFTYKYLEPIAARRLGAREFFFLRLSRIYPLHVATLLVCAMIQWRLLLKGEAPLIYPHADLYHFVLNLFFFQNGAFEEGYSYNGASWSIATEVYAYVVFFALASRLRGRYVVGAVGAVAAALAVYKARLALPFLNETVARAIVGFFVGSLLFSGVSHAQRLGRARAVGLAALVALAFVAAMASVIGYDAFIGGTGYRTAVPHVLGVFPLVIAVALSVTPVARILGARPLTYLGEISYAVYMLHVPLQMIVLSFVRARNITLPTGHPAMLAMFLGALLLLSALVHRTFEVPARSWLRRRLLPPAA